MSNRKYKYLKISLLSVSILASVGDQCFAKLDLKDDQDRHIGRLLRNLYNDNREFQQNLDKIQDEPNPGKRGKIESNAVSEHYEGTQKHLGYFFEGDKNNYDPHPAHQAFYQRYQERLGAFFDTYRVLSTGLVQEAPTAEENFLSAVGKGIALVPFPSVQAVFEIASEVPDKVFKIAEVIVDLSEKSSDQLDKLPSFLQKRKKVNEKFNRNLICNRIGDVRIRQIEIDDVSFMMMGAYCKGSKWDALNEEGAKVAADFAVKRTLAFLEKKRLNPKLPLAVQIVRGVKEVCLRKNPFTKFINKIFGRDDGLKTSKSRLKTRDKKDKVYEWQIFGRKSEKK